MANLYYGLILPLLLAEAHTGQIVLIGYFLALSTNREAHQTKYTIIPRGGENEAFNMHVCV